MKQLEKGIYIQIYREGMRASHRAELSKVLDRLKKLGVKGIAWHGFPSEMTPEVFKPLKKMCLDRALVSIAAFGLNSDDPELKGKRIGLVAKDSGCPVIFNMESAWEDEAADKAKATVMGKAFREEAPDTLAIDQPWPVPTSHWSKFPWEEVAKFIDITAPQYYVNNWKSAYGKDRYERCWTWFEDSWKKLNERLAKTNSVLPRIITIQAYAWDLNDLVHCLTNNDTVICWADPFPTDSFLMGVEVFQKLGQLGFSGPEAVKKFQMKWNQEHPSDLLTVDNSCGPRTALKLGFVYPAE